MLLYRWEALRLFRTATANTMTSPMLTIVIEQRER